MDSTQLSRFEGLCTDLYSSSSPQARKQAHDVLMPLLSQVEAVPQLEYVLGHSKNPHVLLFASNGLTQLVSAYWSSVTESQRDEIKAFLSNYLAQNCKEMYSNPLSEQAMSFMIRLLCRIIKLSWLEGPKYQTITEDVQPLIDSGSIVHAILAIDIYTALTADMQPTKGVQMARFRRTAMSYRDVSLATIFSTSVKMLQDLVAGKLAVPDKQEEGRLLQKILKLVTSSLSFDFMGTIPDETAEDQATIMVPYNWTNVKDLSHPSLFFDVYMSCVNTGRRSCAVLCLQCLVLFASFRRSLYSKEEERSAMLASYMRGTSQILASSAGLDNAECYHEFCRLLGRVNAANQLTELSSNPQFSLWIDQVFSFTCSALKRIDFLPNSMHYLLGFWSVLVAPTQTMGPKAPAQVKQYLEQVLVLFLEARIALSRSEPDEENTDPLEDETLLTEQLDLVTTLSKLYLTTAYRILLQGVESAKDERTIVWLVYLMGAVLSGQIDSLTPRRRAASVDDDFSPRAMAGLAAPASSSMDEETAAGPLSAEYLAVGDIIKRILALMSRTDSQKTSEQLETAYLYFLEQLKKLHASEQAKITSLVTPRTEGTSKLCAAIGVGSDMEIIEVMLGKIFSNFKNRKQMEPVCKKSLAFFHDLVASAGVVYSSGGGQSMARTLIDNAKMKYMMEHHEEVDFGRIDKNFNSIYYSIIFKLIFESVDAATPSTVIGSPASINWSYFDSLFSRINSNGIAAKTEEQAKLIVTLARNLKGVSTAAATASHYNLLFKYLVENPRNPNQCKISLFSAAADVWWDTPEVVVPVLKFIADFAHNRASRIAFDLNSPNGVVLFREAVKVMSAYGQRMLGRTNHTYRDIYEEKYKGIGAALSLFTNTLGGNYANLGVFELYGDTSLTVSMGTALNLCLSIPLNDLSAFLKSLKSVYTFLELATKSHMHPLLSLGPAAFSNILRALEDGITSFETATALSCCVAIDNVCTYCVETTEGADEVAAIRAVVGSADAKAGFGRLLALLNHLSISGEFASTWSLSRPFLGLILVCESEFVVLKKSVVDQQLTPERRQFVEKAYADLMNGISGNLSTKNRESFTKNLYQFGISLRSN